MNPQMTAKLGVFTFSAKKAALCEIDIEFHGLKDQDSLNS